MTGKVVRIATRTSPLARWQAERVGSLLTASRECTYELVEVTTTGDLDRSTPLHEIGGQGVFVKEVQATVLAGEADVAVHSAKDLPASTPDGLVIGAVPERADPRDALVGASSANLPVGAVVGTDAVRRRAQLAALRPDLEFGSLRGNIGTRLAALAAPKGTGSFDAVVVAVAALERLGLLERATEELGLEVLGTDAMLPQVGQGALAVECRADDAAMAELLASIDDPSVHAAVTAERAYLGQLGGGCELPCGALAHVDDGVVSIEVLLASLDGGTVLRATTTGADPAAVGREAARVVLEDRGGRDLLIGVAGPGTVGPGGSGPSVSAQDPQPGSERPS